MVMVIVLVIQYLLKNRSKINLFLNSGKNLYLSIDSANDEVITPSRNPIAKTKATTRKRVPNMRNTNATHLLKSFLPQAVVIFQKVVFVDVGNTSMIFQRESEWKHVLKCMTLNPKFYRVSHFELNKIQRVRLWIQNNTTRQILK